MDRVQREDRVRGRSEQYGRQFCTRNARAIGEAVAAFVTGTARPERTVDVRVYNRYTRTMNSVCLQTILEHVPLNAARRPADLNVTEFGHVVLSETLCVSVQIYATIVAAWVAASVVTAS
jgi:hypothetical protein